MSHNQEKPPLYSADPLPPAGGFYQPPQPPTNVAYGQQQPTTVTYTQPMPPQPPTNVAYGQQQPTTVIYTQPQSTHVIVDDVGLGGIPGARCRKCQVGIVRERFTLCGILWAIFCFPCGLICMFTMMTPRCGTCGSMY